MLRFPSRSMVLAFVDSLAIAAPKGRKSLTMVWSTSTLRSARNRNAPLAARLPQPPDDLEGGVGLARTGRHDQQDAFAPLGDGLDGRVDGVDLVVARRLAACVVDLTETPSEIHGFLAISASRPGSSSCQAVGSAASFNAFE